MQIGLRRGLLSAASLRSSTTLRSVRAMSSDVGDVIGIDLGTTNSCVAIMVRGVLWNMCVRTCSVCTLPTGLANRFFFSLPPVPTLLAWIFFLHF